MGNLGRYLESLYSAPESDIPVLDATIRQWEKPSAEERAASRQRPIGRRRISTSESLRESTVFVRLHLPEGLRVEVERTSENRSLERTVVLSGEDWQMEEEGKRTHGSGGIDKCYYLTDVQRHFDRSLIRQFFLGLRLEERESMTVHGIDCVRFHGFIRPEDSLWPHWLPPGADHYDMVGDVTRGVLLSISAVSDGDEYARYEVTEVRFDAPLDPAAFVLASDGTTSTETVDRTKRLNSPAAAQACVKFTVFTPTYLLDQEEAETNVMLNDLPRGGGLTVTLNYRWRDAAWRLWIRQGANLDREDSLYEWEDVHLPDLDLKISDPGEGMRIVSLVKSGTHISIVTDLDRETALELASSLVPCQ